MSKKVLLISLCMIFILLLCSCVNVNNEKTAGNVETTTTKATEGINSDNNANTMPSTSANEGKGIEGTAKATESISKDYSKIGFELVKEESLFVLNNAVTAMDVIKLIGEPEEKSEAAIWGSDGLEHQTWHYKALGLELGFMEYDTNTQIVDSIIISSPSKLRTIRGIGIGSTKSEILKAYENEINKEESDMDSDSIIAGTVYGGLIFKLENDRVATIFIGAAAE